MSKVITDDKVLALAQHLGVKPSKISDGANGWYLLGASL